jgi:hypothetical protein
MLKFQANIPMQERRGERTVGELSHMMACKQVEPVELFAPASNTYLE